MPLPFHTIWLGGCPPLRVLDNLGHLLALADHPHGRGQAPSPDRQPSIPLLWLDRSAWENLLRQAPLPLQVCPTDQIPPPWQRSIAELFQQQPLPSRWLRIEHPGGVRHAPVLLVEELGLSDPTAAALLQGRQLLAYLGALLGHTQRHWGRHGLLCLASDLLRLLALAWQPGIYGDLGDVAGRLPLLPGAAEAGPAGFCAHHTVAIENDLTLATDRPTLQAITLATALWSWRSVRAIARRLQITESASEPAVLLQPPWTRLADAINLAYGAAPLFHPPVTLAAYSAHRLAPGNAACWERCAARLGLDDYAPQLGWKTYGFGAIERLIDGGRRLQDPTSSAAMAAASRADLARLAYQLQQRLSAAHHQPEQRAQHLAQVETLCTGFGPAA